MSRRGHDRNGQTLRVPLRAGGIAPFFCTYKTEEWEAVFGSERAARAAEQTIVRARHLEMHGPVSPDLCPYMKEEEE